MSDGSGEEVGRSKVKRGRGAKMHVVTNKPIGEG